MILDLLSLFLLFKKKKKTLFWEKKKMLVFLKTSLTLVMRFVTLDNPPVQMFLLLAESIVESPVP